LTGCEENAGKGHTAALERPTLRFVLCGWIPVPRRLPAWRLQPTPGGQRFYTLPKSGEAVSDPEQDNRKRDLKIAKNEAAREIKSDVRLSTWAIGVAIVVGLFVLALFLKR
jgi:hypothetical protein